MEYFARSDWPPTCHRLGFGRDIGCRVEHPGARESFGDDGYSWTDALRVSRERAVGLGSDLFGLGARAFFAERTFDSWIGAGASGTVVGEFNCDNFDHTGLDFLGGGIMWASS